MSMMTLSRVIRRTLPTSTSPGRGAFKLSSINDSKSFSPPLICSGNAFRSDVDDDAVARDQKNSSNQHIAGTRSLETLFHQRLKVIFSSAHLFRQRFLHLVGPSGTSGLCNPYNRARLVSSHWRR